MRNFATTALLFAMNCACSSELNKQSSKVTQVKQQQISSYFPNPVDVKRLQATKQCQGCNLVGADLSNANLKQANLQGADLRAANLSGGKFK